MKRSLICKNLYVFTILLIVCISCSKDEPKMASPETGKPVEEKIEYYVKYQSSTSIPSSKSINISVSVDTEKGRQSFKVPRTWEGTFGPFTELTTLRLSSSAEGFWNTNMTSCRGSISICRGNQPFILKAEKSFQGTSYSLSYEVKKEDLE